MPAQLPVVSCYTEGDTLPLMRVELDQPDGAPVNLANWTARLRIAKTGGGYVEKTGTLQTRVLKNGDTKQYFLITWAAGDFVRGSHMGAVIFNDAEGRQLTTRNILFEVKPPIE